MLFLLRPHRLLRYINKTYSKKCRRYSDSKRTTSITDKLKTGPDLKDFIIGSAEPILTQCPHIPYLPENAQFTTKKKVFFDVYGCQMNLNDTEIVWSILKKEGFEKTEIEEEADIFLVMTCAIREGAESKIWHRLDHLRGIKRRALAKNKKKAVRIGILGCMAERLKEKLIEKEKAVDIGEEIQVIQNLDSLFLICFHHFHYQTLQPKTGLFLQWLVQIATETCPDSWRSQRVDKQL